MSDGDNPNDNSNELTRRFYDRISAAYDMIADSGEHAARESGLKALAVKTGKDVLEIGYGTGHSVQALANAVGSSGKVCGIDTSSGMHDAAMKRLTQAGMKDRVDLRVAPVPPIPWPDDSFDFVTMSFTMESFPLEVIPAVLAETKRVLRPSGRIGIVSMSVTPDGQNDSITEKTYKWMHEHFTHIVDCQPIAAAAYALADRQTKNTSILPVHGITSIRHLFLRRSLTVSRRRTRGQCFAYASAADG